MLSSLRGLPNPFYVLLVLVSTGFVVTCLGYLVAPLLLQQAPAGQGKGPGTLILADWLDRRGPVALGVEFGLMLVSGVLAVVLDPLFRPSGTGRSGTESRASA